MIDHQTHRLLANERIETALAHSSRLAEAAPRERPHRVRRQIGTMLIAAGRRLAPETGASARPARPLARRAGA
jgi:hypothetical protein